MLQRAFLLILFWAVPIQSYVSAVFSESTRQRDVFGQFVWVEQGNYGSWVEYAVLIAISFCLVISALPISESSRPSKTRYKPYVVVLFALIVVSVILNYSGWGIENSLRIILFLACCGYFIKQKITDSSMKALRTSSVVLILSILVFSILKSSYAFGPCRTDKCSPFGTLLNGYFPHENFLALVVLAIFPLVSKIDDRRWRVTFQTASLIIILSSGARTVYIATLIYLLLNIRVFSRLIKYVPAVMTLISLGVFAFVRGFDLSGRGLVYEVVDDSLKSDWFLGGGPTALSNAYESGLIPFLAYHEHGTAPYILARFGVLVFLGVMVLFLVQAKSWEISKTSRIVPLTFLPFTATALTFASETTLQFNISSAFAWTLMIYLSNVSLKQSSVSQPIQAVTSIT